MKKTRGIFIAGTDTGVGKTLISGAIARGLVKMGMNCGVMKPIETGCRRSKNNLIPTDAAYLKSAARIDEDIEKIAPYTFRPALAPYAIKTQVDHIDLLKIKRAYMQIQDHCDFMIVEGIGGLLVPLSARLDLIDLIRTLGLPVLLVARSGLGTLNHSLLTIRYGITHGISFCGILLNRNKAGKERSEASNIEILHERTGLPIFGPFPYLKNLVEREETIARSARCFQRSRSLKNLLVTLAEPLCGGST
ncbi:MAG: dethiobiotin synthase [Nitrospiria bacterium]